MENNFLTILMSTYNGEKYLRQQLLSLMAQTYPYWQLWIRDDGSTDSTTIIIDEFCALDPRIHHVHSSGENLGSGKAFFSLLSYADTDYTIFCDQDDIWLEKKLEELVRYADQKLALNHAGIVYCDAYAYSDRDGVITSQSVSHLHAKNLQEFLFFNSGYQGCSTLFNRPLCNIAKAYSADFYMHDDIISLLAHTFGDVYFLNKPLMFYRQHDCNVTGKTARGFWDMALGFFRKGASVVSQIHYDEKKSFFHFYESQLNNEQKRLFQAYLTFPHISLFKRLWTLWKYDFSIGGYKTVLYAKTFLRKPLA